MTGMEHAIEQAAGVMDKNFNPDRYPIMAAMFRDYARALAEAGLLAPDPLEGVEDVSAAQEWVMIPADQVHDEWAVERPDPVDHQPRYDRFPTLDAALAERWGNDRAVHRVSTAWEPVDTDAAALEGREDL